MKEKTTDTFMQTTTQTGGSFLSRPEIQFWISIITPLIIVAVSWANLSGRVDLLSQKMDLLLENQNKVITSMQATDIDLAIKYSELRKEWGELSQRVTRLER